MIIRRLYPELFAEINADTDEGRATLDTLYTPPRERWLRINLIASVNGAATGNDGTSNSLTNRADRRILGTIRRLADIVLVGAGSVRAEGYFLPKSAPLAIITGSGDLTGHRIPSNVSAGRVIVLCPSGASARVKSDLGTANATVIELDSSHDHRQLKVTDAIDTLHQLGYNSIVCEGGPILVGQLLNAGLVNEICLSTSPQLSSATMPILPGMTSTRPLRLEQLLSDGESYLFARWRIAD